MTNINTENSNESDYLTVTNYENQLIAAAQQVDPLMSTSIGSPIRKILETVAITMGNSNLNSQYTNSFFDLNSKTGSSLTGLASWLGFGRLNGSKSTVDVTFYVNTPVTGMAVTIPEGVQVSDGTHIFQTVNSGTIPLGGLSTIITCESVLIGADNNVAEYMITNLVSSLNTTVSVSCCNYTPATGGTNEETDTQLRARIKNTFLRKVNGTSMSMINLVNHTDDNRRVNVLGCQNTWTEYQTIQPIQNGTQLGFTSNNPNASYVYPSGAYLLPTNGNMNTVYTQHVEWDMTTDCPPTVSILNQTGSGTISLSTYTGSQLDELGSTIGLPRSMGAPSTGTVSFTASVPYPTDRIIPAHTIITDSDSNQYETTVKSTIKAYTTVSTLTPVESVQNGDYQVSMDGLLSCAAYPLYTINVCSPITGGSSMWTDTQYRLQLENYYASILNLSSGTLVSYTYNYCSKHSRNDINSNLTNCVDIITDGVQPLTVTETGLISLQTINNGNTDSTLTSDWYTINGTQLIDGSLIQILAYSPLLTFPSSIMINGNTYLENTDYQIVKHYDKNSGSIRELNALYWINNPPTVGTFYTLTYSINKSIIDAQTVITSNQIVGMDSLVHTPHYLQLTPQLVILPAKNVTPTVLLQEVTSLLTTYLTSLSYGEWVRGSEIERVLLNSPSIQACRLADSQDIGRSISLGQSVGSFLQTGILVSEQWWNEYDGNNDTRNILLADNMLPSLAGVSISLTGDNTFLNTITISQENSEVNVLIVNNNNQLEDQTSESSQS